MTSSGTTAHYQGADPDLLNELSRGLAQAGAALVDHRVGIQQLLDHLGLPPLRWMDFGGSSNGWRTRPPTHSAGPRAQHRRRTPSRRSTPRPAEPSSSRTSSPAWRCGATASPVSRTATSASSAGRSRARSITAVDGPRRWTSTQSRGVFEVEPGLGYGWVSVATFGPHRMYDPWRKGSTTTTYHHDAEEVDAASFRAATGAP